MYDVPVYTHCKTDEVLGVTAVEDIRSEEWQRNKNREGLRMLTMWMMWLCWSSFEYVYTELVSKFSRAESLGVLTSSRMIESRINNKITLTYLLCFAAVA